MCSVTRRALASFGRDVCRVGDPETVIDRAVDIAMTYQPAADESGMWKKMRAEIASSARGLERDG